MANFTGQLWSLLNQLKVVTFKSALIVAKGTFNSNAAIEIGRTGFPVGVHEVVRGFYFR
jgi:hypothetical protein